MFKINEPISQWQDRPHPNPLPRREGERDPHLGKLAHRGCNSRFSMGAPARHQPGAGLPPDSGRWFPLSAGERAGVRAGVITNCRIYFGNPFRQA